VTAPLRVLVVDDQGLVALLAPRITRRLIEEFSRRPTGADPDPATLQALTPRERESAWCSPAAPDPTRRPGR
jgi:hypothetical protein